MPLVQAREVARNRGLDLVEVSPTSEPPVCRLMDYGKFQYEQAKKEREARKSQKLQELREIRLRPKIGEHDFEAKVRTAQKLLADGDKLKVTIMFRGREITHPELAIKLLHRVAEAVKDAANVETPPAMDGRRMAMVLSPTPQAKKVKEEVKS